MLQYYRSTVKRDMVLEGLSSTLSITVFVVFGYGSDHRLLPPLQTKVVPLPLIHHCHARSTYSHYSHAHESYIRWRPRCARLFVGAAGAMDQKSTIELP